MSVCGVESEQLGLLSKDFSVITKAAIMALRHGFSYRNSGSFGGKNRLKRDVSSTSSTGYFVNFTLHKTTINPTKKFAVELDKANK